MKIENIENIDTDYLLRFMNLHWKNVCQAGKENDADEKVFHEGMLFMANEIIACSGRNNRNNVIRFDAETGKHYLETK